MAKKKSIGQVSHEIASTPKPGEVQPGSLVPIGGDDPVTKMLTDLKLGGGYEVVGTKAVTRPVLRQEDNTPIAVTIISAIRQGETFEGQTREGEAKVKPANICFVLNLQTGVEQTLVANAALKSALERSYPDAGDDDLPGYVGKSFAIVSHKRPHKEGRSIREYYIRELVLNKQ